MSSLNRKKTAKAACQRGIALFRGVSLIKRGGLPLRSWSAIRPDSALLRGGKFISLPGDPRCVPGSCAILR